MRRKKPKHLLTKWQILMTSAETRLLRFLSAASAHERWVSHQTIRNTEDLLSGDEKALPPLIVRGLVEEHTSERACRITGTGLKAIGRGKDAM